MKGWCCQSVPKMSQLLSLDWLPVMHVVPQLLTVLQWHFGTYCSLAPRGVTSTKNDED